jgi:hypothetical protein
VAGPALAKTTEPALVPVAATSAANTTEPVARADKAWKLVKTYRGNGDWQSPTIKIKKSDYKAQVKYRCTGSSGGYLYLSWNGKPYGYESANSSKARGTVTLYGHAGGRRGYFEVSPWIDCSWTLKIYQ